MNKKNIINSILENIKTIIGALIIAVIIRSFIFQPFYIPSSSMEPTLLIGDRIFVSKYTYGLSRHSFPFSPNIFNERIFYKKPEQGDLVVFKTPADNRTDYIKRLIGLPGDEVQFTEGDILINGKKIIRKKIKTINMVRCGKFSFSVNAYEEILPNGVKYMAVYNEAGTLQNTKKFKVPDNHFFLLGDNRDCSKDSRYLESVGYVNFVNLVGKAQIIFFSNDTLKGSLLKFWNLKNSFRFNRLFKKIK
ncbi:MAG: signal peptidase I [Candidatus Pelagibacter sp.]|nr:signal peptidase I [Candidatus Pelagibacter sp.]|tara:strand:+ start:1657 stop:2400 length:744 start_codon:yes stop_codon:yes gene_type:complete